MWRFLGMHKGRIGRRSGCIGAEHERQAWARGLACNSLGSGSSRVLQRLKAAPCQQSASACEHASSEGEGGWLWHALFLRKSSRHLNCVLSS